MNHEFPGQRKPLPGRNPKRTNLFMKYLKKRTGRFHNERGAVEVVEAAFVFPVVLFVVILLIFLGNFFYQQAKMDAIAVRGAQYLATAYTNPLLMEESIPTDSTQVNVKPYRYLFGDAEVEEAAKEYIEGLIKTAGTGFFSGMEPKGSVKTCKINNYIVYQTAEVKLEYSIELLPLRFFDIPALLRTSNATVTAATDAAEFIRNVDMLMDYREEYGLTQKIKDFVGKFTGK